MRLTSCEPFAQGNSLVSSLHSSPHRSGVFAKGFMKGLKRSVAIVLLPLLLGVSGCQLFSQLARTTPPNETETTQITQSFHQALVETYPNETIGINVDHTTLDRGWARKITVQFINSSLNESQNTERAQRAEAVARLAEEYLLLTQPQDSISVRFLDSTTYGILTYDRVIDTYTLHTTDLAQAYKPSDYNTLQHQLQRQSNHGDTPSS